MGLSLREQESRNHPFLFSFGAFANCILYQRPKPVFIGVEPDTANIDPLSPGFLPLQRVKPRAASRPQGSMCNATLAWKALSLRRQATAALGGYRIAENPPGLLHMALYAPQYNMRAMRARRAITPHLCGCALDN